MASFRRSVPSLNALVALEAAARHRSITLAAAELGVTQAAVSRQIGAVEADLGTRLFLRRHRAIEPTPECLALAAGLADSFAAIAGSVDAVRSSKRAELVTIGATAAFSRLWLLPRLGEFRARFPFVQIRVVARDQRIGLETGEVDVAVRFGMPPFEDAEVVASRADLIFPVCSPGYAARIEDLDRFHHARVELIATDVGDRGWFSWTQWFSRIAPGDPVPEPALRFNRYDDALEAARAGQGVALGWGLLVGPFLDNGSLVRIGKSAVAPGGRYNVVVPLRAKRSAVAVLAAQWLVDALGDRDAPTEASSDAGSCATE